MDAVTEKTRDSRKKKLRTWRKKKGITIETFAKEADVSYNTAYRWFSRGAMPQRLQIKAILVAFPDFPYKA